MAHFFENQPAYQDLLKRVSLDAGRFVAFIGSGLSAPAKIPTWPELRDKVLNDYVAEAQLNDSENLAKLQKKCDQAKQMDSLWNSFDVLKNIRSQAVFEYTIRRYLAIEDKVQPPLNYEKLWRSGIRGVITLNLDGFAQKSFAKVFAGDHLEIFNGTEIQNFSDALSRDYRFSCNLHGIHSNTSSWIFSTEDRTKLINTPGFKQFCTACFLGASVIFIGVSADDISAGGILERIINDIGITRTGDHYWVTHRGDNSAKAFSDKIGLKVINYKNDNNHEELGFLLDNLAKKNFKEPPAHEIVPLGSKERNFVPISEEDLLKISDPNEIRKQLNKIATNILQSGDPKRSSSYGNFIEKYDQAIHSAWYVPKNVKAKFFDYELKRLIAGEGAFGSVYEAQDAKGNTYAIKILHEAIRADAEMLEAFRRGVASMKILAGKKIPEVVELKEAWEIPSALVMDFIDGMNLQQAVESHQIEDWGTRLRIFKALAEVLLKAHRLPEVVVHRDVRPPNIILRGFYCNGDPIDLVLADFDLSWHRDAFGKSVQLTPGFHGYLAPEQYESKSLNTSRSALVDSYGLAMTMFFVIAGRHPKFEETERADWRTHLFKEFESVKCSKWISLPRRLARIVYKASLSDQLRRVDMTSILLEIDRLIAIYEKDKISDVRLLVDEISQRSQMLGRQCDWDENNASATYSGPSGLTIILSGSGSASLKLVAEWQNLGDNKFETVKKYFQHSKGEIESKMKSSGWKNEIENKYDGVRLVSTKDFKLESVNIAMIQALAKDVDYVAQKIAFKG